MQLVKQQIRQVARFPEIPVLILGETGTGKELAAEAIHELSSPIDAPYVAVNCAAIPDALFESELFGHATGAYTGAKGARRGLLEAAGRGTIFLDEVGELPAALQPKLLRAVESRELRPVGANHTVAFSARIISATNRGLADDLPMRRDLYYRLAGFALRMPSLRERHADIPVLANSFLSSFVRRQSIAQRELTQEALEALQKHTWPGNVRELRVIVQHAAILAPTRLVNDQHVIRALRTRSAQVASSDAPAAGLDAARLLSAGRGLPDIERALVVTAYQECGRNISRAARLLGIPRTTLRSKLQRFGVLD